MKNVLGCISLVLALALTSANVAAQTAQVGQVSGEITDATGGRLPGVTVTLVSVQRGVTRTTVTDAEGNYIFPQLPTGTYNITVELAGFQTRQVTDNLVEVEKTTHVPVTMQVATLTESTTVIGQVPIVDPGNQTQQARLRDDEFEKLPIGRNYQTLMGQAPGVVGTGNVNSHGALTNSNQFLFDGVNTTDPTTGTFGTNLNFEAISEVIIRTAAVSAEFGRSSGAYVDVITKSGTNRFAGSFKYFAINDNWDAGNTVRSEVASADGTFASLARTKFDKVNSTYSGTLGGPIVRNHAWFFVAYEDARSTSPQTQLNPRPGITPENFQQVRKSPFLNARGTVALGSAQNLWVKVVRSPTTGIVRNDYWNPFITPERFSLTGQDQGGTSVAGQYTGVLNSRWTAEGMVAYATEFINVFPFERSPLNNGAPYWDLNDNRIYNGATFDGYVKRPRAQATAAVNNYTTLAGNPHNFKLGFDWQGVTSENSFRYPNDQIYYGFGFDPVARRFQTNDSREDYESGPSLSEGNNVALYARDKFQLGARFSGEAGLRFEKQTGTSDIGVSTVSTTTLAPRLSGSYAITPDGKTLFVASYGRYYDAVLQTFSDAFANIPQQENYSTYLWNGTTYVFDSKTASAENPFKPNEDVSPRHLDEFTFGLDRQIGRTLGGSVRYIQRSWGNFIDDVINFNPDGTRNRVVANIDSAERSYKGVEFLVDKRFSNHWSALGSYTYSVARGNTFDNGDNFTALEDYQSATCRQTVDPGLFGGGTFPCSEVTANLDGKPTYDRPHQLKFNGAYTRPVGAVNLTAGLVGQILSKTTYSKTRTINVLNPRTGGNFATMTYFYAPRGSERVPGMHDVYDLSLEGTWRAGTTTDAGLKFEIFNLFNNEEKLNVSNQTWCNSTATAACATAVANFGKATSRGSGATRAFEVPRQYRLTALVRF